MCYIVFRSCSLSFVEMSIEMVAWNPRHNNMHGMWVVEVPIWFFISQTLDLFLCVSCAPSLDNLFQRARKLEMGVLISKQLLAIDM